MKFVISFFLCASAIANPIRIYHEGDPVFALHLKEALKKDYKIPEDLVDIKTVSACDDLNLKGKLDLCLKSNGDLIEVSVHREFVSESLSIFKAL